MRARLLTPLVILSLLSACGGLDEQEARTVFTGIAGLAAGAGSESQASVAELTGATAPVDLALECTDGGVARIVGTSATCSDSARQGELVLTVEVAACVVGDVTLDGTIGHTAERRSNADGEYLAYAIGGTLSVRGAVDGDCEVDVEYSNILTEDHRLKFTGSVCGHDARSLLGVVAILPPWSCPRAASPDR